VHAGDSSGLVLLQQHQQQQQTCCLAPQLHGLLVLAAFNQQPAGCCRVLLQTWKKYGALSSKYDPTFDVTKTLTAKTMTTCGVDNVGTLGGNFEAGVDTGKKTIFQMTLRVVVGE
jgi:hypothetical protein